MSAQKAIPLECRRRRLEERSEVNVIDVFKVKVGAGDSGKRSRDQQELGFGFTFGFTFGFNIGVERVFVR